MDAGRATHGNKRPVIRGETGNCVKFALSNLEPNHVEIKSTFNLVVASVATIQRGNDHPPHPFVNPLLLLVHHPETQRLPVNGAASRQIASGALP